MTPDIRIVGVYAGSLQGLEYKVMIGDRCYWVGELTRRLLMSGTPPEDLDLYEVDPDEEDSHD